MEYTTLGRTGLNVSVAGLGCGGNSKIGQGAGQSTADSVALIRRAMDLGVNFFDTARGYGTEGVLGEAISNVPRDSVVVSSKHHAGGVSAEQISAAIDTSLRELRTDYVDVYHLHGVHPDTYDHARDVLAPALLRAQEQGKIRFLGITETSPHDHDQIMLGRAVQDDYWDVRNLFSKPGLLHATMKELAADGRVPDALADQAEPLGFLVHDGGAESVIDAAYRYARHEPGADVVLFGTGNPAHLEANIASILRPPLPAADTARLAELFGHLRGVGLDLPGPVKG